jgi:hypothetical protein
MTETVLGEPPATHTVLRAACTICRLGAAHRTMLCISQKLSRRTQWEEARKLETSRKRVLRPAVTLTRRLRQLKQPFLDLWWARRVFEPGSSWEAWSSFLKLISLLEQCTAPMTGTCALFEQRLDRECDNRRILLVGYNEGEQELIATQSGWVGGSKGPSHPMWPMWRSTRR